ncbi:MAG: hypothetical protein MR992_14580 [Lachnospiraceae bacterium]|nr:hypothetical protein [Lachnospiraceae bacterium]
MSIEGNTQALLQVNGKGAKNGVGAYEYEWINCASLLGWLDLSTGDSKHTSFNAKIQESTHIFLCDYQPLSCKVEEQEKIIQVTSDNARMVINGLVYEILLIDNPMEMNEHYEIYLKFVGGQNVN